MTPFPDLPYFQNHVADEAEYYCISTSSYFSKFLCYLHVGICSSSVFLDSINDSICTVIACFSSIRRVGMSKTVFSKFYEVEVAIGPDHQIQSVDSKQGLKLRLTRKGIKRKISNEASAPKRRM